MKKFMLSLAVMVLFIGGTSITRPRPGKRLKTQDPQGSQMDSLANAMLKLKVSTLRLEKSLNNRP